MELWARSKFYGLVLELVKEHLVFEISNNDERKLFGFFKCIRDVVLFL